jgi:hypothetical protein
MQPTRRPLLVLVACHRGKATPVEGGVRVGAELEVTHAA